MADHVYTDAVTGKKIVAGIFHRILFTEPKPSEAQREGANEINLQITPGGHRAGSPFCYISMTEVRGEQEFDLRFVDLGADQVLLATKFRVTCNDPVEVIEVVLPLPMLPLPMPPRPGTYALELLWKDEPLGSHRIIVAENKGGN